MRVSFGAAVGTNDYNRWTKVFDELPAGASNGENVGVCANIAEKLERGVVLEEQIHFNAHSANVLEHVGKLHVLGV